MAIRSSPETGEVRDDGRGDSGAIGASLTDPERFADVFHRHGLYDYVAELPADPDALLAKIRHDSRSAKGSAPAGDVATFGQIAQILDDDKIIPPRTNAAFYRALAKISGVTVVRGVRDIDGRSGLAVTRTEQGNRIQIILDAKTYRYLGTRTTAATDRRAGPKVIAHAGDVLNDTADLGVRVVDQPGQRG